MGGGRGTSITLSYGIKTFDGVVKSPPSKDGEISLPDEGLWRNPERSEGNSPVSQRRYKVTEFDSATVPSPCNPRPTLVLTVQSQFVT